MQSFGHRLFPHLSQSSRNASANRQSAYSRTQYNSWTITYHLKVHLQPNNLTYRYLSQPHSSSFHRDRLIQLIQDYAITYLYLSITPSRHLIITDSSPRSKHRLAITYLYISNTHVSSSSRPPRPSTSIDSRNNLSLFT